MIVFILIAFLTVLFVAVMFLIEGAIINVCWDAAMTTMFGVNKITIFQAFVLAFSIECLRTNYFSSAKSECKELKEKIFNKSKKRKNGRGFICNYCHII